MILEIKYHKKYKKIICITSLRSLNYHIATLSFSEIDYKFEDFILDFKEDLKLYKEKKVLFNIYKAGYSVRGFLNKFNLSSNTRTALKRGLEHSLQETIEPLIPYIENDIPKEDLQDFEIIIKDNFCKLIGEKEKLEFFKAKYSIDYPVLPYYDYGVFHLAFDGIVFVKMKLP